MTDNTIAWDKDADGIVTLTLDEPGANANTITEGFRDSFNTTLDRLEAERDDISGVVVASAKKTFFAGMDLGVLVEEVIPGEPAAILELVTELKSQFRRLETFGNPVVAAINGAALGGGLELALATHHRIAADVPGSQIGLPEVLLGVLPGAGGVARTVRLIGIQPALMSVLLTGARMKPAKAKEIGLVDEIVGSVEELVPAAKAWIKANPDSHTQPWDVKGFKIPGGSPSSPSFAENLPAFPANLHKQLKSDKMPAPRAIMAAALEGAQVDFDNAQLIESRYFVSLVKSQVARNMIQAFFYDMQKVQGGAARPKGVEKKPIFKVGVLGAGMMGAGIAYVTAKAGIDVVLKDVSIEGARKGKAYSENIEAKALAKGRTTEEKSKALLDRITPTADAADFAGVDFVIEAVFEKTELKGQVFREIEDIVESGAVLGSNTSSLPISGLAEEVKKPEDFIGIHFFSPVEKTDPIEIIRGAKTSDETLARAIDYTLAIKKYPIVVNDGRGFFTTRVFSSQLLEAINMVAEGIDPAIIEQAALQAGYAVSPLQLADELNFSTIRKIMDETIEAAKTEGTELDKAVPIAGEVIAKMIDQFERTGKQSGGGFYEYADGKRALLWNGVREEWNSNRDLAIPFEDLEDRLMFIQVIETQKAFDEGVIDSDPDANIGSIFGIGFPPWTGGVRQFVTGYLGGRDAFLHRADYLAAQYGSRFEVPSSLRG
ncbi:3-hydroxyacyl-CoA dehydrogenase [Rhodococcus sp. 1163]|uniref:3-hydroxyacyl-CoA dehydrogenase NAD-binding domain-containing protein n=1 Tax=Rhodococcus sp. 1163 TaxID=1905289 RepID=UPI0009FF7CE0|nr:3-hydroxyacyl-CoA dehydrogenase NAD-binding domain-containing protein [Rhodococcus sp. 1163]ORI19443.1 3-hydroxyacyl-CoA dehydrogenase [Rhodococcus sp. 1163]